VDVRAHSVDLVSGGPRRRFTHGRKHSAQMAPRRGRANSDSGPAAEEAGERHRPQPRWAWSPSGGPFTIIIFCSGIGARALDHSTLLEDLASQGTWWSEPTHPTARRRPADRPARPRRDRSRRPFVRRCHGGRDLL